MHLASFFFLQLFSTLCRPVDGKKEEKKKKKGLFS